MKTIHSAEYKKLLAWLRGSRKAKGLTMRAAAQIMKLPHSWIGKVEIGERRLDIAEYVTFCRVLGVDPHKGLSLMESQMKAPRKAAAAKAAARKRKK